MKTIQSTFNYLFVLLFSVMLFGKTYAQPPDPIWKFANVTSDAQLIDMLTDSVGNCYLTGYFNTSYFSYGNDSVPGTGEESQSAFILKVDPTGKPIWFHSMYGMNDGASIIPKKLKINERGDAVLILEASNDTAVNVSGEVVDLKAGGTVSLVIKVAKNKKITWVRQIISTPYNVAAGQLEAEDMFIEESGNVYVTGYFRGSSAALSDDLTNYATPGMNAYSMLFVARIESAGNVAWIQSCPIDTTMGVSNIFSTIIRNSPAPGNTIFIGGYHDGFAYFMFGEDTLSFAQATEAFISCYTKDGVSQWAKSFHGDQYEYPEDITVMQGGDAVFMGHSNSTFVTVGSNVYTPNGNYNLYLARYNPEGTALNTSEIAIQKASLNSPGFNARLRHDMEGNLIVCSEFQSTTIFSDVFTILNPDPGTNDMFITKLNSATFEPLWTFHGTAPGDNHFEGLHIDPQGNIFFSGTSYNNLVLGPSPVVGNASQGTPYSARVNTNGLLDHLFWQPNTVDNQIRLQKINSDVYGNAYVSGNFNGPANILGTHNLSILGTQGNFIAKYARVKDINGLVQNNLGEPVPQGYVKIYGYTLYQRSPLNDSVLIESDGSFFFKDIPYGQYILVAQPTEASLEVYSQTYFPSAIYWEFGHQITVNSESSDMIYSITLQSLKTFDGITAVDGNISDNEDTKMFETLRFDKGRPVKKAKIVLAGSRKKDITYEIVATTETDDEGSFAFNDVEDGSYYLWADIPGLPVQGVYEITISGHQYVSNLDYLVTEEVVIPNGEPQYSGIDQMMGDPTIEIYPNPCSEFIRVSLEKSSQGIIDIIDTKGVCVKHIKIASENILIDVSKILPGNYLIRIMSEEIIIFDKIAIVR